MADKKQKMKGTINTSRNMTRRGVSWAEVVKLDTQDVKDTNKEAIINNSRAVGNVVAHPIEQSEDVNQASNIGSNSLELNPTDNDRTISRAHENKQRSSGINDIDEKLTNKFINNNMSIETDDDNAPICISQAESYEFLNEEIDGNNNCSDASNLLVNKFISPVLNNGNSVIKKAIFEGEQMEIDSDDIFDRTILPNATTYNNNNNNLVHRSPLLKSNIIYPSNVATVNDDQVKNETNERRSRYDRACNFSDRSHKNCSRSRRRVQSNDRGLTGDRGNSQQHTRSDSHVMQYQDYNMYRKSRNQQHRLEQYRKFDSEKTEPVPPPSTSTDTGKNIMDKAEPSNKKQRSRIEENPKNQERLKTYSLVKQDYCIRNQFAAYKPPFTDCTNDHQVGTNPHAGNKWFVKCSLNHVHRVLDAHYKIIAKNFIAICPINGKLLKIIDPPKCLANPESAAIRSLNARMILKKESVERHQMFDDTRPFQTIDLEEIKGAPKSHPNQSRTSDHDTINTTSRIHHQSSTYASNSSGTVVQQGHDICKQSRLEMVCQNSLENIKPTEEDLCEAERAIAAQTRKGLSIEECAVLHRSILIRTRANLQVERRAHKQTHGEKLELMWDLSEERYVHGCGGNHHQ